MKHHYLADVLIVISIGAILLELSILFDSPADAAQSRVSSVSENKKIAVCVDGPTHQWTSDVGQDAEEELDRIVDENQWEGIFRTSDDTGEQSDQIREALDEGIDALVLMPVNGASLKTAAVIAQEQGVPIVIFDRQIPNFSPTATVTGDNYGIGQKTAEHFNRRFPHGTTVLEILGDRSTVPYLRADGYNDHIASNITTIEIGYAEWSRSRTREVFRDWLAQATEEEKRQVGAIFTHDDEIALGVLDVLDGYARAHDGAKALPALESIAASSSSQEFYRRIRSDKIYDLFSMRYGPEMVRTAVDDGAKILLGQEYDEVKVFPTEEINKDNVERYIE